MCVGAGGSQKRVSDTVELRLDFRSCLTCVLVWTVVLWDSSQGSSHGDSSLVQCIPLKGPLKDQGFHIVPAVQSLKASHTTKGNVYSFYSPL